MADKQSGVRIFLKENFCFYVPALSQMCLNFRVDYFLCMRCTQPVFEKCFFLGAMKLIFCIHCKYIQCNYNGNRTHLKSVHFTSICQCRNYSKKLLIRFSFISLYFQQQSIEQYIGMTMESKTHVKSVKITLNIRISSVVAIGTH